MLIKTIQEEIQNYLNDASNFKGSCEAVYFPENKDELISIIKEANISNKKITVSGNRTGLTGACVPEGGIVISTEKLNKIIEINTEAGYAVLEPAVLLSDFLNELKHSGYFYPPDPTEKKLLYWWNCCNKCIWCKNF